MSDLTVTMLLILGLASYRLTHFVVDDSLIDGTRNRVLNRLAKPARLRTTISVWRYKLIQLLECFWCVGVWMSLLVTCIGLRAWPWGLGWDGWLFFAAVAGAQTLFALVASVVEGTD